jgi:replicative DNA helicase
VKEKKLLKTSQELQDYVGEDQVISSHDMKLDLSENHKDFVNVKSRIPSLDREVEGFRDGELIIISGPTKNGKTLLAQTLTINFVKSQEYPLWFSFEVPGHQFLSQFPELPLFYLPRRLKANAMDWLEERCLESFFKYRTRIIFIDHLHFLFDLARTRNPSIEIGTVIRRLKTMAVQNGWVIFLLAHTTKGKQEENLSYESIRDSSFISQESDCVLMIKRIPEVAENAARLKVEFHRRTGVLEKKIDLLKVGDILTEQSLTELD